MSNTPLKYDEEIDLLGLIETVWKDKWKIVSIAVMSLLSVFSFTIVAPNTTFTASTEIKPITSFEFDKYSLFNSSLNMIEKDDINDKDVKENKVFNIFEITQKSLLNLYIEQIEEGSLLENAVDKFSLINKDEFDSESDYKDAVEKFVSEIEVLKPIKENNERRLYHVLSAEYNDRNKWKNLLTFVNNKANKKVKATIINRFATIVSIENQKKDFNIKDIEIKINNVKKDYGRYTKDRIAFLTEQAAIARKLDIQKNTIASQRFNAQNTFVTNVKTDAPFYLRGYLAIEEEIKQIKNRKNKTAFIKNLYELEQKKRTLKQDKTVERAIELFNKTPLNDIDFQATIVKVATTDFELNDKSKLHYTLALFFGGMIGVVYVFMTNAFKNRKKYTVSS